MVASTSKAGTFTKAMRQTRLGGRFGLADGLG
jgi:hypothetical protein